MVSDFTQMCERCFVTSLRTTSGEITTTTCVGFPLNSAWAPNLRSALQFKTLNSQLNKEVADFERAQRSGAHTLVDSPTYDPSASTSALELESEAQAYVLGGSASSAVADTREDRRRLALEAAIRRIRKEEEELEHSCGTAGPS